MSSSDREEPQGNLAPLPETGQLSKDSNPMIAAAEKSQNHHWSQFGYGNSAVDRILTESATSSAVGPSHSDNWVVRENPLLIQRKIGNRATSRFLFAKLNVSRPDDQYEREADALAEQVLRSPEASLVNSPKSEALPGVQSQSNGFGEGGESLQNSTRSYFEPRFGQDFGSVRVHQDAEAAQSAAALNARAFTAGQDIVFGSGEYSPETTEGRSLLAHELTHVVQQSSRPDLVAQTAPGRTVPNDLPTIQRSVSPHYSTMVSKLSYGVADWVVTGTEAHQVLDLFVPLSLDDLSDTALQLDADGYLDRLLSNIRDADRASYASVIALIRRARTISRTSARIESFLSYGILDWTITDRDAHEVLVDLQTMPVDRRRELVFKLVENGHFDRLISNISSADRASFATLIRELNRVRDEYRDRMLGTGIPDANARQDVEAQLTPGVVRNPVTGVPDPFVDKVAGHTYRQDLEAALDGVRAWMFPQHRDLLAGTRLPMTRFEGIGVESKRQTDAVFGRYNSGPALRAGTRASGANLIDRSLQTPDPADLVRYLIHDQDEVQPVHRLHSAIPSRSAEQTIINAIIVSYSHAHKAELEVMDRGWPALESRKVVEIQPFRGDTPAETRQIFWRSFQTLIHEYLHSITHRNYERVADGLGGQEASVLIEGGTSLFTDDVWNTIFPDEIRANDDLRANVEGSRMPFDAAAIPAISHYDQIAQARTIRNRVGAENMRAAYFLGHTELIGLGPTWTATGAATGEVFVVPAIGMSTLADVALATGVSEMTIAPVNGLTLGTAVTPGQQLTVPGIRIHTVISAGAETKVSIADRNGITEAQLTAANPGVHWTHLTAGQRLVIPKH